MSQPDRDMTLALEGKRAVITGAGRGIGRAIALAFAQAGADVALVARTAAGIESLAEEIAAMGSRAVPVTCDVTDPEQVGQMAAACMEALGGVDILVNNAGSGASHRFID